MRKQKDKLIIVGNDCNKQNNGPSGVIKGLILGLEANEEKCYYLVLKRVEESKVAYVIRLIKTIVFERNAVVNVHTDGFFIPLIVYLFHWMNFSNRYCLTCHGIGKIEKEFGQNIRTINLFIEKILYKKFPELICVSQMEADSIKKIYGREKKVIIIPNATDAWDYDLERKYFTEKNNGTIKLVSVGGLSKLKGIEESLKLVKEIKMTNEKVCLNIFGNSTHNEEQSFMELAKRYGLKNEVKFHGKISKKSEMYNIIAQHDFMLCLSKYDTFNVAILEAVALGCICIPSVGCGAAEIVKNNSIGVVYDVGKENYSEIVQYIKKLKDNIQEYNRIQKLGYCLQKDYSWERISKKYMELLDYVKS